MFCKKGNAAWNMFSIDLMNIVNIHNLTSCKMLILKISEKCSLTLYIICFPTVSSLAEKYPLVATKA